MTPPKGHELQLTPYVAAEVVGGRLVRVCPECRQEIIEVTDATGMVSDNFGVHWEAEHREEPPTRQRCYVLAFQPRTDGEPGPGPEALRDLQSTDPEDGQRQDGRSRLGTRRARRGSS